MHLNKNEYEGQFPKGKREKALDRAWKNRDFEIELYWKRATYFWTFLVAVFAGYFIVISNPGKLKSFPQAEYLVSGIGLVFSYSWYLVNLGSKKWQENWEKHIDLLENKITGPIYKTVLDSTAYSVTGINKIVSLFITFIWGILMINYLAKSKITMTGSFSEIDWLTTSVTLLALLFLYRLSQEKKYSKRNTYKDRKGIVTFSFSRRQYNYLNRNSEVVKD